MFKFEYKYDLIKIDNKQYVKAVVDGIEMTPSEALAYCNYHNKKPLGFWSWLFG